MRTSDENQHGSTRPNLMSASRRTAGSDDKILAKLERGTPAGAARHAAAPSLAWLGAGGGAIVVLIGALVWVAYVNTTTPRVLPVDRSKPIPISRATPEAKASMPGRAELAAAQRAPAAPAGPATTAAAPLQVAAAAVILDEPAERYLAPAKAAQPRPAPAATAPARSAALRQASYTQHAAKPARNGPARGRTKGSQVAPAPAEPALDSDIALLTAMIAHSAKHAENAQQDTDSTLVCDSASDTGKKCPVKAGALLQALRKTTN